MYKLITINGTEYKLEYTVEASLYSDCISSVANLMAKIEEADNNSAIQSIISGISNIPQTALTLFYAGLLEHHGKHALADGSVPNMETAKVLVASYIREHKDDETGNFYGILNMCLDQMGEDGFFKTSGLEAMITSMVATMTEEKPKSKAVKTKKVSEK